MKPPATGHPVATDQMAPRPPTSRSIATNQTPPRYSKLHYAAAAFCYFLSSYYLTSWLVADRVAAWQPALALDRTLPFIPTAIYGYLLVFAILLLFYALADAAHMRRGAYLHAGLLSLHLLCFIAIPITIARPELAAGGSFTHELTRWYFLIDPPRNLFPSLHVSQPLLVSLLLWRSHRRWSLASFVGTAIIAISVVLVKQHYIMDVVAAVIVTGGYYWVSKGRCFGLQPIPC